MDDQSNHPTIFVVDENVEDSFILFIYLKEHGLERGLHTFSSVGELIGNYKKIKTINLPRIILVDGFLKHETIVNALSTIKSIPKLRDVPILVMIGANYEKEYLKSFNLNVSGYILKPVDIQLLKRYLKIGND